MSVSIGALQPGNSDVGSQQTTFVTASIALSPTSGDQWSTFTLTVTGTATHFDGTTTVGISGTGVTFGSVTVSSATSLSVPVTIAYGATTGARTITVTTGAEAPTASFTVNALPTASVSIAPATGQQQSVVTLTVTGTNTHFGGTTVVSVSGTGITAGTPTVASATSLTVDLVIGGSATTGSRTITVTTSPEAPTASFTVTGARGNIDYDQIRGSARQGPGALFQMAGAGGFTSGHVPVYDANGNLIDGAAPGTRGPATIGIVIDGGGSVPLTGDKGFVQVPYNCTITGWTLLADPTGSCQITISKCAYSGFPTVSSIVASAPPALASNNKGTSTTLTGWTTAISATDILWFHLDSITTCTRIVLELQVTKA